MPTTEPDTRTDLRKALDHELSSEPHLPQPKIDPDEQPRPLEDHLCQRRPVAIAGVVENGVVRVLDPHVRLPEHSRVIVVASEPV